MNVLPTVGKMKVVNDCGRNYETKAAKNCDDVAAPGGHHFFVARHNQQSVETLAKKIMSDPYEFENNQFTLIPPFDIEGLESDDSVVPKDPSQPNYAKDVSQIRSLNINTEIEEQSRTIAPANP